LRSFFLFSCFYISFLSCNTSSFTQWAGIDKACTKLLQEKDYLKNFRSKPIILKFMDNVHPKIGEKNLEFIQKYYPDLIDKMAKFQKNDSVGNPNTYPYSVGDFCPATLRYIKIAGDIDERFSHLEKAKIVEIGGGYGGQCRIIKELFPNADYTIVDLKEVLLLAKSYLDAFNLDVTFTPVEDIKTEEKYDLVISNFAFSECTKEVQDEYLNTLIKNSEHGYMIMYNPFEYKLEYDEYSKVNPMRKKQILGSFNKISKKVRLEHYLPDYYFYKGDLDYLITW